MTLRRLPYVLTLGVAIILFLGEINRIGALYLSSEGRIFTLTDSIGLFAVSHAGQWQDWSTAGATPGWMVILHVIIDSALFIPVYVWLFVHLADLMVRPASLGLAPIQIVADIARRRFAVLLVKILVGVDIIENLLLASLGLLLVNVRAVPPELALAAAGVSVAKTLLTFAVLAAILGSLGIRHYIATYAPRILRALYAQRLTAIIVLLLVILSLVPWGLVLEQLPDVERSWFDGRPEGVWHGVVAIASVIGLAISFYVIGRKRSEIYWIDNVLGWGHASTSRVYGAVPHEQQRPTGWLRGAAWLAIPIAVIVASLFVDELGKPFTFFLIAAAIVFVLAVVSEIAYYAKNALGQLPVPATPLLGNRETRRRQAYYVIDVGDILAVSVLVIGALGLFRSFVPSAVIGPRGDGWQFGVSLVVIAVAIVGAFSVIRFGQKAVALDPNGGTSSGFSRMLDPRQFNAYRRLAMAIVISTTVSSAATLFFISVFPITLGNILGVVAVLVLILGSWTTLVAYFMLLMRQRRPLAIFEFMRLRSDPIVSLFLIIPILVGQLAGVPGLHAIDRTENRAAMAPGVTTLSVAFHRWVEEGAACAWGETRPLVLVAAQGGGIRAATWTVGTLSQFADRGPCAARSVFLSSGVSGGSVGLAVAATSNRDGEGNPAESGSPDEVTRLTAAALDMRQKITDLSYSAALPSAVSGLTITDPLASTTGLRFPTWEIDKKWSDRASLIEQSWRDEDAALDRPFDGQATAPTGYVVFNSTDVRSGCRVIVSQIELGMGSQGSTASDPRPAPTETPAPEMAFEPAPRCDEGIQEPALTIDLTDFFRNDCAAHLDWATASMLSARFPVVTPAGGVGEEGECTDVPRFQLIDGGYAENTGLGLIADLAPSIGEIVRYYNTSERSADDPVVVPHVMFIQNDPGGYIAEPVRDDIPELQVPIVGQGTAGTQVAASAWIQRALTSLQDVCGEPAAQGTSSTSNGAAPEGDAIVAVPCNAPAGTASDRVVIVAIGTQPSIAVPLGWALSGPTRQQLFDDVDAQGEATCQAPDWSEYKTCLGKLIDALPAGALPLP